MSPRWTDSTEKHGVTRVDAAYAIAFANYSVELEGEAHEVPEGVVVLYIGPRHAQALPDDEIEILVHQFPDGREAVIFHVMPLGPKYRTYREENPS